MAVLPIRWAPGPGLDDLAPDVAGHQVVGLVLNDQIRRRQLLQPPGHGLHRAHRYLAPV